MSRSTHHFLGLLDVELADVCEDLREVELVMKARARVQEITPYVFHQNAALLEREIEGIKRLRLVIANRGFDDQQELHATAEAVMQLIRQEVKRLQLPEALSSLLDRRIRKVLDYVDCCT